MCYFNERLIINPPTGYCLINYLAKNQFNVLIKKLRTNCFSDIFGVKDTTGYTLIKKRHRRVPTTLQRETDTAD